LAYFASTKPPQNFAILKGR
jgi:hypothetical protein